MNHFPLFLLLGLVFLLCAGDARARDGREEQTIITATRTSLRSADIGRAATVLEREDIARIAPTDLVSLLRHVPGVQFARSGGLGAQSGLFVRGTESDHVLLLVDGLPVEDASLGGVPSWHIIPPEQIERIEVVRGPVSSLYGSRAIGGVVHIMTRRAAKENSASIGFGSHGLRRQTASLHLGGGDTRAALHLENSETQGTDHRLDHSPDSDGYRTNSAKLSLEKKPGTAGRHGFGLDYLHAESESEYDDGSCRARQCDIHASERIETLAAHWKGNLSQSWQSRLAAGYAKIMRRARDSFPGHWNTRQTSLYWQNDWKLGGHSLFSLGAQLLKDRLQTSQAFAETERHSRSVFAQWQGDGERHYLALTLHYENNKRYGNRATGGAHWTWEAGKGYRLGASYNEGFRAPSFSDLYGVFGANPDLDPEESKSYEVNLKSPRDGLQWEISAFRQTIDHLITFAPPRFVAMNIDRARIEGLEAQVRGGFSEQWRWQASASLLNHRDEKTGRRLLRRARKLAGAELDYNAGDWQLGASLHYKGEFSDFGNHPDLVRLPGYTLAKIRFQRRLGPRWSLGLHVENAFDKSYQPIFNFRGADRDIQLSLRWQSGQ